jgi:hypothetical protein
MGLLTGGDLIAQEGARDAQPTVYYGGRVALEQRVNALTYMQKVVSEANELLKLRIEMVGRYLEEIDEVSGLTRFVLENEAAFKERDGKGAMGFEDAKSVAEEHIEHLRETQKLGDYGAVLERGSESDAFLTYAQGVEVAKGLAKGGDLSGISLEVLVRHAEAMEKLAREKWEQTRTNRHRQDMMRAYLGKIEKFDDYMEWAIKRVRELQEEELADLEKLRKEQRAKQTERRTDSQRRAAERQRLKAEQQRIELARKFELRKQQLESETRIREANARSRNTSWGGWGALYPDVYYRRD